MHIPGENTLQLKVDLSFFYIIICESTGRTFMKDVTAAVIIENEKVLITRRAADQRHAGWWEFPGGKVEDGESPEACLRRELMEELGVDAHIGDLLAESIFQYETGAIRLLAYCAEIIAGEIRMSVHDEFQWVSAADLAKFKLLPADRPIAEKLGAVMPGDA